MILIQCLPFQWEEFSKEVLNQFVKPLVIIKFLYKAPLIKDFNEDFNEDFTEDCCVKFQNKCARLVDLTPFDKELLLTKSFFVYFLSDTIKGIGTKLPFNWMMTI